MRNQSISRRLAGRKNSFEDHFAGYKQTDKGHSRYRLDGEEEMLLRWCNATASQVKDGNRDVMVEI